MEETNKADAIAKKIRSGKSLSRSEEIFYLTVVFGHTLQEAKTILAITANKNDLILID